MDLGCSKRTACSPPPESPFSSLWHLASSLAPSFQPTVTEQDPCRCSMLIIMRALAWPSPPSCSVARSLAGHARRIEPRRRGLPHQRATAYRATPTYTLPSASRISSSVCFPRDGLAFLNRLLLYVRPPFLPAPAVPVPLSPFPSLLLPVILYVLYLINPFMSIATDTHTHYTLLPHYSRSIHCDYYSSLIVRTRY